MMDWINDKLKSMTLEESINDGNYVKVRSFCEKENLGVQETIELIALAQIRRLSFGRGNFTREGIALWDSQEIRDYLMLDTSDESLPVPFRNSMKLDSPSDSVLKLINAMKYTIGYHVETGDSKGYSPGRRAAIDLFLSEQMDYAIQQNIDEPYISEYLAKLIGTSYHCIFVTSVMEINSLEDFREYVQRMEKWTEHLSKAVQADIKEKGIDSRTFSGFGEFDSTIGYMGITTKEDYDRLREITDVIIGTTIKVYDNIDKVSKQVGDWLSYIPDDDTKSYILQELIKTHGLNVEVLDKNTIPTEVFLEERIKHPLQQWMDYGTREWFDVLLKRVQTEGNKKTVANAMVKKIMIPKYSTGIDEYDVKRVLTMTEHGDSLYCEETFRTGVKDVALQAFADRDMKKLRLLTPLIQVVYENESVPKELKALCAPQQ
jgi:hypothetical protein